MRPALFFLCCLLCTACTSGRKQPAAAVDPYHYTSTKRVVAQHAAVVSAHPLATAVGLRILQKGGNAFDAVISVQLALAVVYPNAGNLGGGGFMLARKHDGTTLALDYREVAPARSHRDLFLDSTGAVMPGRSVYGHRSAGVPGTVAGLMETLKHARLPLEALVQPAIALAGGFAITPAEANGLNKIQEDLERWNTVPNAFMKKEWKGGDTLRQPDLQKTLVRIRDKGAAGFYRGETADRIVAEMQRGGGIISHEDLQHYKPVWREAYRFPYKGFTVLSMPLPSSGGLILHQVLHMSEAHGLSAKGMLTPGAVQLMTEAERRAYADRASHLGDPAFYRVPVTGLTHPGYLQQRMKDYLPGRAGSSRTTGAGQPGKESEETTHISIMDAEGNAVSVTTTLNNSYGGKTVVGGAGFFLNDEMDDFSVKPGVPNIYGAIGGEANAIAPGKRMLSSMTPTIVLKDDRPFMIVGTPGGTTIPTTVFQVITGIIDFGRSGTEVMEAPRFHHQWLPDEIFVERAFPRQTREAMQHMGYVITERSDIGRVELILVREDKKLEALADKRGDDAAAGY